MEDAGSDQLEGHISQASMRCIVQLLVPVNAKRGTKQNSFLSTNGT